MSESLGTAFIDVRPITAGFEQQLKRQLQPTIDRVSATANASVGRASAGVAAAAQARAASAANTAAEAATAAAAEQVAAMAQVREEAKSTERASDGVTAGFGRARIAGIRLRAGVGFGALAAGLVVASQASRELSNSLAVTGANAGTTQGKLQNLGSELLTGNIIGGLKALAVQSSLTDSAVAKMVDDINQGSFAGFQAQVESANVGVHRSISKLLTGQTTIVDFVFGTGTENKQKLAQLEKILASAKLTQNRDFLPTPSGTPFSATPEVRGGTPGLGLRGSVFARAALAAQKAAEDSIGKVVVGLSERLQAALAGSQALGTTGQQIAQVKRARDSLVRQLQKPGISDADRVALFNGITGLNAQLEGLLKAPADGVQQASDAVAAARKQLEQTVAEGRQRVSDALASAQTNLTSFGNELVTEIGSLIDAGPLGDRIKQLQNKLGQGQFADQRRQLRSSLQDAKKELSDAEGRVQIVGTVSAADRNQIDSFLTPFREKVKDAQAALGEFNTEGIITQLEKTVARQKETVERGIDDLIARFEAGGITLAQLNAGIGDNLAKAGITNYAKAGDRLGFAFREKFLAQLRDLRAQAAAILDTPAGTKPTSRVVSPAQVARDAAASTQQARDELQQAQKDLADKTLEQARRQTTALETLVRQGQGPAPRAVPAKPSGPNAGVTKAATATPGRKPGARPDLTWRNN